MQKYFTDQIMNNKCIITGDDYHHISKVMRGRVNDEVILVSDQIFYRSVITLIDKQAVYLDVLEANDENHELPINVTVAQALIKKDNFDLMLKKSTELGVHAIIPTEFEHSIVKLSEKSSKIERWQKITKEAAEQSFRNIVPQVHQPLNLKQIDFASFDVIIVAYENEKNNSLTKQLKTITKEQKVLLVIGPEGGISEKEITFLQTKNVNTVTLGPRILRSETASLYFLSALSLVSEN